MIRIKVTRDSNHIKQITFKGHAYYDDYGKDIVCASVSATMLCTVNGILAINEEAISVDIRDDITIIDIKSYDEVVNKLIDNMIRCLESLEIQYPKNIRIK